MLNSRAGFKYLFFEDEIGIHFVQNIEFNAKGGLPNTESPTQAEAASAVPTINV